MIRMLGVTEILPINPNFIKTFTKYLKTSLRNNLKSVVHSPQLKNIEI